MFFFSGGISRTPPPNSDSGGGWPAKVGGAAVGTLTLTHF